VPVAIWVRVNDRIYHEDAGAFEIDREQGVLVFKAFKIEHQSVLIGATVINVLQALAEAAQD
jgi:hypothetical protein